MKNTVKIKIAWNRLKPRQTVSVYIQNINTIIEDMQQYFRKFYLESSKKSIIKITISK